MIIINNKTKENIIPQKKDEKIRERERERDPNNFHFLNLAIKGHLGPDSSTACKFSVESTIQSEFGCGASSTS